METQQQDLGEQLQAAVMQAAINDAVAAQEGEEKSAGKREKGGVSPVNGVRTPSGRPKGVKNRLTNLRDAVIEAFDAVGGAEYLAGLAKGTQSDRAAFVSLVSKVLPTQINANVEGGIQVQLSWLGNRNIGAIAAQPAEVVTEVIDLQRDNGGKYRIIDQPTQSAGAGEGAAAGQAGAAEQGGQAGEPGPTDQNGAGGAQGA